MIRRIAARRAIVGAVYRSLIRHSPVDARDRRWLPLAVLPGAVAVGIYLATNAYPALGAGLYTQIAREILAMGYALPARIPGYTADGVPFAYPPLQFYVYAVLLDLGGGPLAVTRVLPGLALIGALVPVYLLTRDHTGSRPAGALAAALVALNPQLLKWHLSAGGIVRAFALLYALLAIYAGYHVFRTGRRSAVLAGVAAFGVTLLTHPTYALFVVVTYLLFWGGLDRTAGGIRRGLIVGVGGTLLAGPWLAWIATTHGPGILTAAAGTHGGVGGGLLAFLEEPSPYAVAAMLVAGYFVLVRRDWFLAAWIVATGFLFEQPRFLYTTGAIGLAVAGNDLAGRATAIVDNPPLGPDRRTLVMTGLFVAGTLAGGAVLAHGMTHPTDPTTAEYIDDDSMAAMDWVAGATDGDATFVVLGDAAEWFPVFADRVILISPWGVEWEGRDAFDRHLDAYDTVSACQSVACVETTAALVEGEPPEYVYVPKGQYSIRGENAVQFGTIERSFEQSSRWERVFENDGAVIYRAVD